MKVKVRKITDEKAAELVLKLHKLGKFNPDYGHRPKKPIPCLRGFMSLYDRNIIKDSLKECKEINY